MTVINMSSYVTVREASVQLDITEEGVRDLIKAKEIKATKIGKWRISPGDLDEFVKGRSN